MNPISSDIFGRLAWLTKWVKNLLGRVYILEQSGGPCNDCPVTVDGVTITGNGTTGSPLVATAAPIPSLQQVLDTNHDLTDGNNFQGTNAGSGITGSPIGINAFGTNAAFESSGSNVNAFGKDAGSGNTFSDVNLFGKNATATASKQLALSTGTYNTRIGYAVNADRLFEFPKNVDGTFSVTNAVYGIDLNPEPYYILSSGVYEIADPKGNQLVMPDASLMEGQEITIINLSGGYPAVFFPTVDYVIFKGATNQPLTEIPPATMYTFKAINGKFRGGFITN